MNIVIVGAGNIGTQFAVHCAEKGHEVTLFGSKPAQVQRELAIVNDRDEIIHRGVIAGATDDPACFGDADLIFVTVPAFCMADTAAKIFPYARKGLKIGLVPGTGGGECAFRRCLEKGAVLFGLQRVPSVARLVEYGKTVRAVGYREILHAAAIPAACAQECSRIVAELFDRTCVALPNYLTVTLTPSNPILHTARLRVLYKDYQEGKVYERVPLFYQEWDDESSRLLLACDEEVQQICRTLDGFDLSQVRSLREHYESPTPEALTEKITGIKGFQGLASPAVRVNGGYIPDLNSRYFTADFPYGLSILVQIASMLGLDAPNMRGVLDWYLGLAGNKEQFFYRDYGIESRDDFEKFYEK